MKRINELIVVEGKSDIDFLSTFLDADFYSVNGSAVSKKDLAFIKEVKKYRNVIVLTDPDFPGKKIRDYLNNEIPGLKNAYVRKEVSIRKNKVGVAESTKEEVGKALENLVTFDKNKRENTLSMNDLFELELNGSEKAAQKRKDICDKLQIEKCNAKRLLFLLNMMGVDRKKLEELLDVKC